MRFGVFLVDVLASGLHAGDLDVVVIYRIIRTDEFIASAAEGRINADVVAFQVLPDILAVKRPTRCAVVLLCS